MGKVVGLTGKYCAGKNAVAELLEEKGFHILDADRMGHAALDKLSPVLTEKFGTWVLKSDGAVDRRKLGAKAYRDLRLLKKLENLVHPQVISEIKKILNVKTDKTIAINTALLFYANLHELCDMVILVDAPLLERVRRGKKRDNLGYMAILRRIWRQKKYFPKDKLKKCRLYRLKNKKARADLVKWIENNFQCE